MNTIHFQELPCKAHLQVLFRCKLKTILRKEIDVFSLLVVIFQDNGAKSLIFVAKIKK